MTSVYALFLNLNLYSRLIPAIQPPHYQPRQQPSQCSASRCRNIWFVCLLLKMKLTVIDQIHTNCFGRRKKRVSRFPHRVASLTGQGHGRTDGARGTVCAGESHAQGIHVSRPDVRWPELMSADSTFLKRAWTRMHLGRGTSSCRRRERKGQRSRLRTE